MRIFCLLAITLAISCADTLGQNSPSKPTQVSLIQLIATPEKYDGMTVIVYGFLEMNREGDLLFLSKVDSDNVILSNGIWIRRTEQMGKDRATLNGKYVVGVFHAGFKEQLGNPAIGISEVQLVAIWSDPLHPLRDKLGQIPGVSSNP